MRHAAFALWLILVAGLAPADPVQEARLQAVANRLVAAIRAHNYAEMQREFTDAMRASFTAEKASLLFLNLEASLGRVTKLDPPRLVAPDQAIFPLLFQRGVLDMKIVLDDQGRVAGLFFQPHTPRAAPAEAPRTHETRLSLPFRGQWLVLWGGDTKDLNQHHDTPNQRYAFDFLGANDEGKTRKGEAASNEDYYAFGREILAPADGVVTEAIDGVRDNAPGSMNPYSAVGNCVIIQHRDGEASVLAHLKQGSVRVRAGDRVTRGQFLGLCGNSGNSSEPHLHYHLQTSPILQDGKAIKPVFDKVVVNKGGARETRESYSPVKGDLIGPEAPDRPRP